jgi:hypothetical protein
MKRIFLLLLLVGLMSSVASATSDWTGAVSSDWADGNNWSDAPGGPDTTERRDICVGQASTPPVYEPVVSADSTAGVIMMGRTNTSQTIVDTSLTVSAGTLTVQSAGNELVSVSYDNTTNALNVDGGNLVVYNASVPGTGEIRLQHSTNAACIGNVNLYSGSIDTERLSLGSSHTGGGTFTATGGTLTVRSRIDRFGLVADDSAYGFRLGGATLELSDYTDRDNVIGNVTCGQGADTDFIMESDSTIVLDLGDPGGGAGVTYDLLTVMGNFTLDGELVVDFGDYVPSYGDTWDVIVVNPGDASTYTGSGMFDTLPTNIEASLVNDNDTLELTYVPEPATLALLALGGLIAVRRRK